MTLPVAGHEYVIITKTIKHNTFYVEKYTGKCQGAYTDGIHWLFFDVARVKSPYDVKSLRIFTKWDEYLELNQMIIILHNGKKARDNMEKRASNMILKRLINEHFEW